ncbi:MAG: hypothetical protein AAF004_07375, partial [Pseudomonadota bacterium]
MTAVFTSSGLGLFNSSIDVLGQGALAGAAAHGQSGEQVFVNAASGNLVLRRDDEFLVGQGLDGLFSRTYNSQGGGFGGDVDDWMFNIHRSLSFSGTANTVGSTVTRRAADGSLTVFNYDQSSNRYISTDGSGAHNEIARSGNWWFFYADGGEYRERYRTSGQLNRIFDRNNTQLRVGYNSAGRVTNLQLRDPNGSEHQRIRFSYWGANRDYALRRVQVDTEGNRTTLVEYDYDGQNRLDEVRIDLTLDVTNDSQYYYTRYTYEGTSSRIATMTQSDGTELTFGYTNDAGTYRVSSVTNALGEATQYTYGLSDAFGQYTEVLAATGATTKIYADGSGRLVRLEAPAVDGQRSVLTYAYDGDGNLSSVTDSYLSETTYSYDNNGNRLSSQDALGNRIEWTYTNSDQVRTRTEYRVADPDGNGAATAAEPLTYRYIYDNRGQMTHAIDPTGGVTHYVYDSAGNQTQRRLFVGGHYDVSGLSVSAVPSANAVDTWIG